MAREHPGLGSMAATFPSFTRCFLDSPFRCYTDQLEKLNVSLRQGMFAAVLVISMLQRIEKDLDPQSDDIANVQRNRTVDFIVKALGSEWPEWSMPLPCPAPSA